MRSWLLLLLVGRLVAATNSLTIHETNGTAQDRRPESISRFFKAGEIPNYPQPVINGTPANTWQSDCKTFHPTDKSARHCIVSFTHTLPRNGSNAITFRNSTNPCSSGAQAACEAAALDAAGMLAFNSAKWGAVTSASFAAGGASFTKTASARTCVADGNVEYWLRGPVVTEVICESTMPARSYDFGAACTSNCTGDYASATWRDDPINRSLHPWWQLRFYQGWNGVQIGYGIQNAWTSTLADQRITLNLYTGASGSALAYGPHTFTVYARTNARKARLWDGQEPGAVRYDMNRDYLSESGVIPTFDPSIKVSNSIAEAMNADVRKRINSDAPLVCTNTTPSHAPGCGGYRYYMPGGGGYPERALVAQWYTTLLYSWHAGLWATMLVQGDIAGTLPIHLRDDVDDGNDFFYGQTSALNRPVSLAGRPTYSTNVTNPGPIGDDVIRPLAPLTSGHKWTPEMSHFGSFAYIPYVLTGDWYYLQELYYAASWWAMTGNWGLAIYGRGREMGFIVDQTRGEAWALRAIADAAFAAPDGSPEKLYFSQQVQRNIDHHKGRLDIRDGPAYRACCETNPFNPGTDRNPWMWGRWYGRYVVVPADFRFPTMKNLPALCDEIDTDVIAGCDSPWMQNFAMIVWGQLIRQGFTEARSLHGGAAKHFIEKINSPASNPNLAEAYRAPTFIKQKEVVTTTENISANDTVIRLSSVPPHFTDGIVVRISGAGGTEYVRICKFDAASRTATACSATIEVGRGIAGSGRRVHPAGSNVTADRVIQSWQQFSQVYRRTPTSIHGLGEYADIQLAALASMVEQGHPGAAKAWQWLYSRLKRTNESGSIGFYHYPATFDVARLAITIGPLPDPVLGVPFSALVSATGGSGENRFTLAGGKLCDGLVLSVDGTISGTPLTMGTCKFEVRVDDEAGSSDVQAVSLTVGDGRPPGEEKPPGLSPKPWLPIILPIFNESGTGRHPWDSVTSSLFRQLLEFTPLCMGRAKGAVRGWRSRGSNSGDSRA